MRIMDTYAEMQTAYEGDVFCFEKWNRYIDAALPDIAPLIVSDARQSVESGGVSWERDILSVLNAAAWNAALREKAYGSGCCPV